MPEHLRALASTAWSPQSYRGRRRARNSDKVRDKAFKNVNEAQGVGLILQAGALQRAKMRLAQGPLGAGRVHLLGILLAEGPPEDRTKPRAPKDISHPSTILLGHNRPSRFQMGGKKMQFWVKSAFHSQNITADAASLEGKGKCKESWKTFFQSFGEKLIFPFSIYLGRVFFEKQLEKFVLLSSSSAGPQPLAAAGAPPSPALLHPW